MTRLPSCPVCASTELRKSRSGYGGYQIYCSRGCATYGRNKIRSNKKDCFESHLKEEMDFRKSIQCDEYLIPYVCQCGRRFSTLSGLSRHARYAKHRIKRLNPE